MYVANAVFAIFCLCVIYFQAQTIDRLTADCSVYSLKQHAPAAAPLDKAMKGVAVTLFLGSPRWFQNRYAMMVNLLLGALPNDWVVQIFYHPTNKMSLEAISAPGILKQVHKGNVLLTPIPERMKKLRKKELLSSRWLWENMVAERVLTFGGTNTLCANSHLDLERNFTSFDYIGTPWSEFHGEGGDGGLSLRSRKAVLDLLPDEIASRGGKEDSALMKLFQDTGSSSRGRVAEKQDTTFFGINDGTKYFSCSESERDCPLGAQGTLSQMSDEQRIKALEFCPELKLFFPVLHATSCFGANPRPLQCFKFLCESGGLKCGEETAGQISYKVGKKRAPKIKQGILSIKF